MLGFLLGVLTATVAVGAAVYYRYVLPINKSKALLNTMTSQSTSIIEELKSIMEDTTKGALLQSQNVGKSTSAMQEISNGVQQTATSVSKVSTSASEANTIVQEGKAAVDTAVNQMGSINANISELSTIIEHLNSHSKEITQVVEVISSISGQINLLSLNAAIEAARAGAAGKGFGVVANEVKVLAGKSAYSAQQISNLIDNIKGKIAKAVDAMERSTHEVQAGLNAVDKAGKSFQRVSDSVCEVTSEIQELAATTEQMASGTGEIIRLIDFTKKVQEGGVAKIQEATNKVKAEVIVANQLKVITSGLDKVQPKPALLHRLNTLRKGKLENILLGKQL